MAFLLAQYEETLRRMDASKSSALFVETGEIVHAGCHPIRGREAIRAFLASFTGHLVVSDSVREKSIAVQGSCTIQWATYEQTLVDPVGRTVHACGEFSARWERQAGGGWLLGKMQSTADP